MKEDIPTTTAEHEIYKENILDHYRHPHNKEANKNCTCQMSQNNPVCGDQITIYLEINEGRITKATFDGSGCAISQAAASMLTDYLKNKTIEEAETINKETICEMLGIPLGPVRIKCALLCVQTTQKALEEYNDLRN